MSRLPLPSLSLSLSLLSAHEAESRWEPRLLNSSRGRACGPLRMGRGHSHGRGQEQAPGAESSIFREMFFRPDPLQFYAIQIFNLTPYMTFTRKAPESRPSSARPHLFKQLDPSFGRRACAGSTAAERSRWFGPSPRTPPPSSVTRRLSGCWPRAPCSESSDDRS